MLCDELKKIRTTKELSVYRLSKLTGVSENYIRKIEKGESTPSITMLELLLKPLGITLAEFFNENENVIYPTDKELELIQNIRTLKSDKVNVILDLVKVMQD